MKKILGILIVILHQSFVYSQIIDHEKVVAVKFSIEQKESEAFVVAKINIIPGWHINSNKLPNGSFAIPTEINLTKDRKSVV